MVLWRELSGKGPSVGRADGENRSWCLGVGLGQSHLKSEPLDDRIVPKKNKEIMLKSACTA